MVEAAVLKESRMVFAHTYLRIFEISAGNWGAVYFSM